MQKQSVETILGALNRERVRYLVVGGLAVVAHGFVRFTADLDLVLDPERDSLRRAIKALFSAQHPATEIDLFVEPPFDFDRAYAKAVRLEVGAGVTATFVGREELIEMKRSAGRPQDLADLAGLEEGSDEEGATNG
ncbi:MAG TPA: DUF6036 family nucleotidyltransferase [Candidatus Eisenbacteria bacterium]|nr:DUF6036 family nucleotidyltransferase [Candidatus Eisenbacteria bacterium]